MNNLTKLTGHLVEAREWTDKKPTVPGYWWNRKHGMMTVWINIGGALQARAVASFYWRQLEEVDGEWSGPIAAPTDAPAQDYYKAEEVEAAIAEEPEMPGDMPEERYDTVKNLDKQGMAEWCRIIVRQTKQGLLDRLKGRA